MQVLFLKIFPCTIDTFSTVINRDVNGKKYLCAVRDILLYGTPIDVKHMIVMNRKLKITELNRISTEEFKEAEKLPLAVVLDNIRSPHNIGSVFRTSDAFRIECIVCRAGTTGCSTRARILKMHKTALGAEFTVDWEVC